MVQTRSQNKQAQTEEDKARERAQNALRWRKFYESNSFEYNRKRLVKRILEDHVVRLKTLKKYQLEKFYEENTTKENLKVFKEEVQFERELEKTPVPEYINETVSVVANNLRNLLIGNTHSSMDPEKIDVKVNVLCPDGGVAETSENIYISGTSVDEQEETFSPDGTESVTVDNVSTTPAPATAPTRQPYTLKIAISDVMNHGVRNDGKPLKPTSKKGIVQNLKTIAKLLECLPSDADPNNFESFSNIDFGRCLKKTRFMKNLQYKIVDGKKVRRQNYGKQLYSSVISLYRYSPQFQDILGDKITEWNDEFDKIMKKWRAEDKKKRDLTTIDWQLIANVLQTRKIEFDQAEKAYKKAKKEFEKKKTSAQKQAVKTTLNDYNRANMYYLIAALYTLQPPRRANTYSKMLLVDDIPVENVVGRKKVINDPTTGKVENYYGLKNNVFVLQEYKTSRKYFQMRFPLTRTALKAVFGSFGTLRNIIQNSVKVYPREYLIVNPNNGKPYATLSSTISTVFSTPQLLEANDGNPISANILRHSYVTYMWKKKKINDAQKKDLARLMLHQVGTAESSYLQKLDDYVESD